MGLYNVVASCVVGKLHYIRPTAQPIEVDDAVAEPLVESGCLERYAPGGIPGKTGTFLDGAIRAAVDAAPELAELILAKPEYVVDDEPPTIPPPARKPRGRKG